MTDKRRILLVEDSEDDVELITGTLEARLGGCIDVVRDGAEAIEYLDRAGRYADRTSDNPAVVVLDLKLPKVNGVEVLKHIRSGDALRTTPVVILTSSRETRDVADSYALGASAYVVKPVRFEEFAEAVTHLGVFWAEVNEPPVRRRS